MFAVIETGGKQYRVRPDQVYRFEKLPVKEGESVTFDHVLLVVDGQTTTVGAPYVTGATVLGDVLRQGRADKILVRKFKPKVRYRRLHGHRQPFTEVKITGIKTA